MRAFPIRLFHAILFGLFLGTVLSITSLHMFSRLSAEEPENPAPGNPPGENPPAPTPLPVLNPTPDDFDGDGMPNTWETQYHHNPQDASDAGADFDNDGLTAVAEYQLHQQTSGVAGNPLGKWKSDTVAIPEEFTGGYFYPVDINGHGDVLVNADIYPEGNWRCAAFIVSADGVWTEIVNQNDPAGGYLWANDFNDQREVVGAWYSADWSEYQSYKWDPVAGFRPFTFQGGRATSYKINNYGDWLGSVENPVTGEWTPAFVVDGINQHAPGDWWSYLSYTDLNDYGEAMGSYYNPQTGRYNTFLAHGGWSFDTGLLGNLPVFDQSTYSYSWSSAMNAYGEFTGGAGGYQNNQWSYMGYHFDGEFNEISLGGRDLHYLSPASLNSANTIVGDAGDSSGHYGAFIYRDGVGLFLDELLPGSDAAYSSRINEMGRFVAVSQDYQRIFLVSPDQDQDQDGDGMSDDWEDFQGLDKTSAADAFADADGDGNNNLGEYLLLSDPNAAPVYDPNGNEIDTRPGIDTDGDGIPNVWEWENGLNYDDASDAPLDYDRDGYTNLQEFRLNTDPRGAPSYRIREVGPFQGASSASLSSAVLGDGAASASYSGQIGANVTESVFFPAKPTTAADGGQRPAAWSLLRSAVGGYLSFTPSHGSQNTNPVAQAPGGASLCYFSGSPTQFVYWATPTSAPVMLSGASSANDISYLYNAKLSPSGNFLVATRSPASVSGVYQPVIWKMPLSATATVKPIRLVPPAGVTLSDWPVLHVSDYGHVVATGTVGGQNRPILWTINETGTAVTSSILPPLPGGIWASVSGISNQSSPLICGTSAITGGQSRATVWNASGIATNLGTLPGGSYSTATVVSRGGKIAGLSNVLVGNTLKYQPFLASYDPASATWKLQVQGTPGSYPPSLQLVNDSGEILGRINEYTPAYRQVSYLWRHGRAYPLDTLIPASSGHTLDTIKSINPNGTLLATTWKDGAQITVILTPDSDTDGDGLPDAFENQHAFNSFVKNNPATDSDSDGLTDLDEYRNGTQPRSPDTDNDGMKDGWEVSWGLLPLDPSDAALDPDGDHVTNLRESQIGTTPTGIYKVETRLTDTDWTYPNILSADDSGQIIHTGQYQYGYETDESGFQVESYSQDHFVLGRPDAGGVSQTHSLPPASSYTRYNSDWTEYSYSSDSPSYWPDAAAGMIHGAMSRNTGNNNVYGSWWEETLFLIPDAANSTDESSWIPWETIETNLRGTTIDNSFTDEEGNYIEDIQTIPGVIDETDTVYPNADAISPSGIRRIHRTAMGQCLVLNESGGFIESLPASTYWQKIDDQGRAIALTTRRIVAANGLPAYYAPELKFLSYGYLDTIPIPHEPGVSPNDSLHRFSNDGRILLSRTVKNAQLVNTTQYQIFDINTRTLSRVRQPGIGNETIASLSANNGRLLGTGPKPFQITPDGTCIRLEALRIKNTPAETPIPFGTLYPRSLTPNHIASDGRVTLTTTNSNGQTVILQIVPCNDADDDGVPDDWEKDYAAQLLACGQIETLEPFRKAELLAGNLDSGFDYAGNGVNLGAVYAAMHEPQSLVPNPTGMRFEMQQKGIQGKAWEFTFPGGKNLEGFYNTHGINSGGTGGGYYGWFDSLEKIPTIAWTQATTNSQDYNHLVNPLFNISLISLANIESWHKIYHGSNWVNYRVKNEKRRIRIWSNKLVAAEDTTINFIKAVFYQPDPHPEWDAFTYEGWFTPMPTSAVLENSVTVKIKIPKGKTCSEWYEYETPLVEGRAYKVFLLPVEVVELSPKLPSEANETVAVPGSEIPQILPESNPLVERDPLHDITDASTRRIAWRDLKVKIGSELSNKTVTWRMTPQFTPHIELGSPTNIGEMITVPDPNGPRFRGSWEHAKNEAHQDAFSASEDYGSSYNWNRRTATTGSTPGEATTKVHEDGYTAIRVNVPPIGFNKARVSIQIEGSSNWIDLIDLEVPAVVVIDPGHGGIEPDAVADKIAAGYTKSPVTGEWTLGGSAANHATAAPSKTLEKNMALDCGRLLRDRLKILSNDQHLHLKLKMTRDSDDNLRLATRANFARDHGADHLLSIHFNGFDKSVRGCEVHVDKTGNLNKPEDWALAERVDAAVFAALHGADNGAVDRHARDDRGLDVRSDPDLGNITSYTPCRAVLLEMEYIDVAAVDRLLNTGGNHQQVRQSVMNGVADAQLSDLRTQPAN